MMISGAGNLYNKRDIVDDLNVFPVPDGDTGTNMSMTMNAAAAELSAKADQSFTRVADIVSFATLRGARGNSGVILSQIFRGFSRGLKGIKECNAEEFARGLNDGAAAAYKAVMQPTEGTILTVARESAKGAYNAVIEGADDVCDVLQAAVDYGNAALSRTTQMLPVLLKAGVVDAGGQGWMFVLEGALEFLKTGEVSAEHVMEKETDSSKKTEAEGRVSPQAKVIKDIKFQYCTEFIIEKKNNSVSAEEFKEIIGGHGDSMLVIDDEDIVKVHIHTNHPGIVLEEAIKLGDMINLKIDNMKRQHNSILETNKKVKTQVKVQTKEKNPEKEYGIAAVSAGKGMSDILADLGVDKVIEGGQTMNPSTEDLLKAINRIKAKTIFLFPNNKNIIMAANQAKDMSKKNVIVIPSKNVPQCIAAVLAFNGKYKSDTNERNMNKAMDKVQAAQITYAVRDTEIDGVEIKKNDILGIIGSEIKKIGNSAEEVCAETVAELYDDDENEFITVYYGKGVKKAQAEALCEKLEKTYPDAEVTVKKGGQPVYYYIVSVE